MSADAAEQTDRTSRPPAALVWLGGATVVYAIAAAVVAPEVFPSVFFDYLLEAARALPLILMPAILILALVMQPRAPLAHAVGTLRERGLGALAVSIGFCVAISAFTTFKLVIPQIVPFYADGLFERIDRVIHGGPPWAYTHGVVPEWAEFGLAYVYSGIWYILWFGVIGFAAFWRDPRRVRYLWAHGLMLAILGTGMATALSSYGPIFFDYFDGGPAYDDLLATLNASAVGRGELNIAAYLYSGFSGSGATFGTGISAMPSMHVAVVVLNACFFWSLDRRLGAAGWGLVALILLGSVHFGWHYAVDGYVPLLVVPVIWWATGRWFAGTPRDGAETDGATT